MQAQAAVETLANLELELRRVAGKNSMQAQAAVETPFSSLFCIFLLSFRKNSMQAQAAVETSSFDNSNFFIFPSCKNSMQAQAAVETRLPQVPFPAEHHSKNSMQAQAAVETDGQEFIVRVVFRS